ncbi:hypothetical protein CSV80_14340 [Sporosarcina sp. P12(2017)]|nr:hypothetical protein CSV81_14205 [Sporosarcina sp. P10]PIC59724.1 hypothetical protein CSV80_14340 [Sporosarcina sp. P12(2017)]
MNGKTIVVDGRPQDFMKIVQGVGILQNKKLTCINGEEFKFERCYDNAADSKVSIKSVFPGRSFYLIQDL